MARCIECEGFLCQKGIDVHKTFHAMSNHQVISINDLKSGKVDIKKMLKPPNCTKHKGQALWLFCNTCRVLICQGCTVLDHCRPAHIYVALESVIAEQKESIREFNKKCDAVAKETADELAHIGASQHNLNVAVAEASLQIDKVIERLRKSLDSIEKEKRDELAQWKDQATKEINKVKTTLESHYVTLAKAQLMAKEVLTSGTNCDVASVYSQLTTTSSMQKITEWVKPRRRTYGVEFTRDEPLIGPDSTIGVLRYEMCDADN